MNVRLFNDNGCETMTEKGQEWSRLVRNYICPLAEKAVHDGISLRDVQTIILDEVFCTFAEERLRRGLKERKNKIKPQ